LKPLLNPVPLTLEDFSVWYEKRGGYMSWWQDVTLVERTRTADRRDAARMLAGMPYTEGVVWTLAFNDHTTLTVKHCRQCMWGPLVCGLPNNCRIRVPELDISYFA
jgi:hypothetical protein